MINILISGGGGFIGANFVKYLLESDSPPNNIIVIDNFISSEKSNIYNIRSRSRGLQKKSIVHIIEGDICDTLVIERIKAEFEHIDRIYHLASLASPKAYGEHPIETLDVGYIGTKNMLELCKHYNSKQKDSSCKFLFSSTSEVYGAPLEHPQKESYYGNVNCYGTRCMYDESKRVGEALVYTYRKLYNLDTKVIRIFNTYGPYMNINDGRIVTEIIKAMLQNGELKIFGSGEQTRSLSYVDDTIKCMHVIMESDEEGPINVGNDKEITINQLVNICNMVYTAEYGKLPQYNMVKTSIDKDDPKLRRPCLEKLKEVLQNQHITFTPSSIEEGLRNTLKFFSQNGSFAGDIFKQASERM